MTSVTYRKLPDIAETLRNAKRRGKGCALLVGAGCSVKADIPTAAGFVKVIEDRYPRAYERAREKTYPGCMSQLMQAERRDLIREYVDQAKINWAHLCMGLLMQSGYVDRVLTTNFDLLVVRACAMLGTFPATYDFASSHLIKEPEIPDKSVFYLHGQHTGFVLMNTKEEVTRHSKRLAPVFADTAKGRVWLVVGYSGENDPVFDHLARIKQFEDGLFWVGYGDREPAKHVRERLLTQGKDAFFIRGFDADSFFISLTRALGVFPPDLIARPFTYLERALGKLTPWTDPGQGSGDAADVTSTPRKWINEAKERFEGSPQGWERLIRGDSRAAAQQAPSPALTAAARYLLMEGRYEEVLRKFRGAFEKTRSPELADILSMACVIRGNELLDRAKRASGGEARTLFARARAQYVDALEIHPRRHEAMHNWGNLLLDQAKRSRGGEAELLFDEAEEKFRSALEIDPNQYDVHVNWGNLLLERAKVKLRAGEDPGPVFHQARRHYEAALEIEPRMPEAFHNLGNLLLDQAKARAMSGESAEELFDEAEDQYRSALEIDPDRYDLLVNWGNLLLDRAKTKEGPEAERLFDQAEGKYRGALDIKPDMFEAAVNWGNLLLDRGKAQTEARGNGSALFDLAEAKYRSALEMNPDQSELILENWGNLVSDRTRLKHMQDAEAFLSQSERTYTTWLGDELARRLMAVARQKFGAARAIESKGPTPLPSA